MIRGLNYKEALKEIVSVDYNNLDNLAVMTVEIVITPNFNPDNERILLVDQGADGNVAEVETNPDVLDDEGNPISISRDIGFDAIDEDGNAVQFINANFTTPNIAGASDGNEKVNIEFNIVTNALGLFAAAIEQRDLKTNFSVICIFRVFAYADRSAPVAPPAKFRVTTPRITTTGISLSMVPMQDFSQQYPFNTFDLHRYPFLQIDG